MKSLIKYHKGIKEVYCTFVHNSAYSVTYDSVAWCFIWMSVMRLRCKKNS